MVVHTFSSNDVHTFSSNDGTRAVNGLPFADPSGVGEGDAFEDPASGADPRSGRRGQHLQPSVVDLRRRKSKSANLPRTSAIESSSERQTQAIRD